VNSTKHYPLCGPDIGIWNKVIISAKPSNIDSELKATLRSPLTKLVMRKASFKTSRIGLTDANPSS